MVGGQLNIGYENGRVKKSGPNFPAARKRLSYDRQRPFRSKEPGRLVAMCGLSGWPESKGSQHHDHGSAWQPEFSG